MSNSNWNIWNHKECGWVSAGRYRVALDRERAERFTQQKAEEVCSNANASVLKGEPAMTMLRDDTRRD